MNFRCKNTCNVAASEESNYEALYEESEEECPLTRSHNITCQNSKCIWRFRLIIFCLIVMCVTAIGYLIYLQSLLGIHSNDSLLFHGAVASDNFNCSKIGTNILKEGGNAVDAAIATAICMAVVTPYKTGLGGGGIAMFYHDGIDQVEPPLIIDFATNTISGTLSALGKIRIPSLIRGLELLHRERGKLKWNKLIEPAENLSKNGFIITENFFQEISKVANYEVLYGYLEPGKLLKLPNLGETLEIIKNYGTEPLYNGSLALKFLHDEFHELHNDLLAELAQYKPIKSRGNKSNFYGYVLYSPQHSKIFHSILAKIQSLNITIKDEVDLSNSVQFNIAKTLIENYGQENKNIEQEQYTTVVAMDSNSNLVSILSGLSSSLGLGHMTEAGFLLDTVHSGNNFYSFTPVIFTHPTDNNLREYSSGVFGFDDPLLAIEILSNLIIFKLNLSIAIETQRYYRLSDGIIMEPIRKFPLDNDLAMKISRLIQPSSVCYFQYVKSVNGIVKKIHSLYGHSDSRGGGIASRYER